MNKRRKKFLEGYVNHVKTVSSNKIKTGDTVFIDSIFEDSVQKLILVNADTSKFIAETSAVNKIIFSGKRIIVETNDDLLILEKI